MVRALASVFSKLTPQKDDVLGAISLIFWSITLIVLLKYVCIVLNANDQGEGEATESLTMLSVKSVVHVAEFTGPFCLQVARSPCTPACAASSVCVPWRPCRSMSTTRCWRPPAAHWPGDPTLAAALVPH